MRLPLRLFRLLLVRLHKFTLGQYLVDTVRPEIRPQSVLSISVFQYYKINDELFFNILFFVSISLGFLLRA